MVENRTEEGEAMIYPTLAVQLITYNRPEEIRRTIDALLANIIYPENMIEWWLVDDHSPDGYVDDLLKQYPFFLVSQTSARSGWQANCNLGLRSTGADLIFHIEDDRVAKKPIDLMAGARLIAGGEEIVRYREVIDHPGLKLQVAGYDDDLGHLQYLKVFPGVPPFGLYAYSGGPHLKTRKVHSLVGYYNETCGHRIGEEDFCHRANAAGVTISILPQYISDTFDHIGKLQDGAV